jgi:hypothetical protein
MIAPLKSFGFDYEHNGRNYALTIVATTREDAQAQVASMAKAVLVGEMKQEKGPTSGP